MESFSIQIEKETQARFLQETGGWWSPIRWVSDWSGGVKRPGTDIWDEAESLIAKALQKKEAGDLKGADQFLQKAEASEQNARATWQSYLEGTQRGAQSNATLAKDIRNGAAIADAAGLVAWGAAAVFPAVSSALPQIWEGFSGKLVELSQSALTTLSLPQYWARFTKIGAISASIRATYDLLDKKETKEIGHNALFAFLGGGLCSGLIPNIPVSSSPFVQQWITPLLRQAIPFNYVALDLLGDASKNYLVDIRDKHGDAKGLATAGTLLAAENGLATLAFLPFLGSWTGAVKTVLTIDAISIGMETYLQHVSGKEWREVDPGRFVGMSAWGHSVVVLPEAILGGATKAAGLAQAVARTTELGTKYVLFVNPSVNNFQAKVNHQNWQNVQIGNTTRHASLMWLARFIQATLGPSHPVSMLADEGIGVVAIGLVNAVWPVYEGIPEVWSPGFFQRVRTLKTKPEQDKLTDYLSHEMGSYSLMEGYLPSRLNLKAVEKLVDKTGDPIVAGLFKEYLVYLNEKRSNRTIQEEKIAEYLASSSRGRAVMLSLF